jgi:hypothetical protein
MAQVVEPSKCEVQIPVLKKRRRIFVTVNRRLACVQMLGICANVQYSPA